MSARRRRRVTGTVHGAAPRRPLKPTSERRVVQLPSTPLRVAILAGAALILVAVILFRLWFLQILSGQQFEARANDNRLRNVKIVAPRGSIVDRHGKVLVQNRPGLAVGIRPMDVPDGELPGLTHRLARVLRMTPTKVRKRLDEHLGYPYDLVVVKEDVGRKVVSRILERKELYPGVEIRKNYLREYPQGRLAPHLLGHLGEISARQLKEQRYKGYAPGDVIGQGGVEATYDRWLRGRDGVARLEVDAFGRPKSRAPLGGRLPENGDSLVLTLDARVQERAQEAVEYGIRLAHRDGKWQAAGGAAVVLDVRTGAVVAMASYPSFDPGVWNGGLTDKEWKALSDPKANQPLVSKAFQGVYAAGSTFKVVDAVAGLEEGVIDPYTRFYCNGRFPNEGEIGDVYWNCWDKTGHGSVDLVRALAVSCDVYFYNVGYAFYQRPGTELADWAMRLGLGKTTGLDAPGEVEGLVPTPAWRREYFDTEVDKLWKPGNSILLSIGQGDLQVTPLQMAVVYAAIANGGTVVQPHLGLRVESAEGKTVRRLAPRPRRKLEISRGTLDVVRRGLRMAATSGTSAPVFAGYPVAVAGKTGTAEVFGKGDYAWYASYAPADDPRYAVVVMIEQGGHGGTAAAPATRLIYDALFDIESEAVVNTGVTD